MNFSHFEYLTLLFICFSFPFLYSLIHCKILAKERVRVFHPTVFLAAIPFMLIDIIAVSRNYWHFNPQYIMGFKIFNLPIEEFLFFILIPQASLLIWIALNTKKDILHHFKKFTHR